MAGEQASLVRQGQDLLTDAVQESIVIATWQIGAPDATLKDHIPAKGNLLILAAEDNMPRGMPGRVSNFELVFPQVQDLSVEQVDRWLGAGIDVIAEQRRPTLHAPKNCILGVQRHRRRRVAAVGDRRRAANMVKVGVRQPDIG